MNELTWQTETDPVTLLLELYPRRGLHSTQPQTRKCRMYLLACARRQWGQLPAVCRALVELAERYADSPKSQAELRSALAPLAEQLLNSDGEPNELAEATAALTALGHSIPTDEPLEKPLSLSADQWQGLIRLVYLPFEKKTPPFTWVPQDYHSIELLREVVGNPCRYIPFSSSWRTDTALSLARQMYESREFSAMPILADALQDAGCDNEEVLNHCRDDQQQHVRGCWVVDLVLNFK
ncbi:MAG: hypothetical protein L0241_24095 [Planctomycetia bacterium]|nr:hypothetical protein [Planctomycetia bacterium]